MKLEGFASLTNFHKEKSNMVQQDFQTLLSHFYKKLNAFRATHRPSSGA